MDLKKKKKKKKKNNYIIGIMLQPSTMFADIAEVLVIRGERHLRQNLMAEIYNDNKAYSYFQSG